LYRTGHFSYIRLRCRLLTNIPYTNSRTCYWSWNAAVTSRQVWTRWTSLSKCLCI